MHELVKEGDVLVISAPKNHFALAHDARLSLLLACGVRIDSYAEIGVRKYAAAMPLTCAPQKLDTARPELVTRLLAGCGIIAA